MSDQIVVIDDDPINNLICEKIILGSAFADEVKCFTSSVEALDWLCKLNPAQYPRVIFLDINLPIMSGWVLIQQLQTSLPGHKIRIYMLSSSASLSDQLKAESQPEIAGFVVKPLTKLKLESLL